MASSMDTRSFRRQDSVSSMPTTSMDRSSPGGKLSRKASRPVPISRHSLRAYEAARTAQDAIFPKWMRARPDFQKVFPRFCADGRQAEDELTISAFEKDPLERTSEDCRYITKWMRQADAMKTLTRKTITKLAMRRVTLITVEKNRDVFHQGDVGDAFYMIFDGGPVDVIVDGVCVTQLHAPASFGELSLITGGPRLATIRAAARTRLVTLLAHDYRSTMQQPVSASCSSLHLRVAFRCDRKALIAITMCVCSSTGSTCSAPTS